MEYKNCYFKIQGEMQSCILKCLVNSTVNIGITQWSLGTFSSFYILTLVILDYCFQQSCNFVPVWEYFTSFMSEEKTEYFILNFYSFCIPITVPTPSPKTAPPPSPYSLLRKDKASSGESTTADTLIWGRIQPLPPALRLS